MFVAVEKYMIRFFFKKLIRFNYLGEYLFFKILSLFFIVALFMPLVFSVVHLNDIYLKVFNKELDFNGLNRVISNFHLSYLFVMFLTLKTDYSYYYPFFRLPVNKKKLITAFFIKTIFFNKFSILLFGIIVLIALTNNILNNSTILVKFKWLATNFIILSIIGLVAFYNKKIFIAKINILTVLILILTVSSLSLFITSDLFVSLLKSPVNFLFVLVIFILIIISLILIRKFKLTIK